MDLINNNFENITSIEGFISLIISICVITLFFSIFINFMESKGRKNNVKVEKKSIVETGTMTGFFVFFYLLIKNRIGVLIIDSFEIRLILAFTGLAIIVLGCVINIIGRVYLGKNWANQIRIYDDHTLVRKGMFKIVRHPLYASIIWMFFGASLVYLNYPAFFATLFIFVPFMYYRAKQEEVLLSKKFKEYDSYKFETGMFFPKIWRIKK